jgi:hypothetical protein
MPKPALESISLLDSDHCSSDSLLEHTPFGYSHTNKAHSFRFLTLWEQLRPFLARHVDKPSTATERRPTSPRAARRLIPITLGFGACVWLLSWAARPLSTPLSPAPAEEQPPQPTEEQPPLPLPLPLPLLPPLSLPLSNLDTNAVHPGIFDVCSFVHLFICSLCSSTPVFRTYVRSTSSFRSLTSTSSRQRVPTDGPFRHITLFLFR